MPISLLAGDRFTPEQTRELIYAYEDVLTALNLNDRTDPFCELVAKKILECAKGDFDRASLYSSAMSHFTK